MFAQRSFSARWVFASIALYVTDLPVGDTARRRAIAAGPVWPMFWINFVFAWCVATMTTFGSARRRAFPARRTGHCPREEQKRACRAHLRGAGRAPEGPSAMRDERGRYVLRGRRRGLIWGGVTIEVCWHLSPRTYRPPMGYPAVSGGCCRDAVDALHVPFFPGEPAHCHLAPDA